MPTSNEERCDIYFSPRSIKRHCVDAAIVVEAVKPGSNCHLSPAPENIVAKPTQSWIPKGNMDMLGEIRFTIWGDPIAHMCFPRRIDWLGRLVVQYATPLPNVTR